MRNEGWRLDALRRLDEVQQQQQQQRGAAASKDDVDQALTGLEARIEERG